MQIRQHRKAVLKRWVRRLLSLKVLWFPFALRTRVGGLLSALHAGIRMNWAGQGDLFNFRRSIHRLEKGLSFSPRRPVFAEEYIGETVLLLERGKLEETLDEETIKWGEAVLSRYFSGVQSTPRVKAALERFSQVISGGVDTSRTPYPARTREEAPVSIKALLRLAQRRRSVRFYLDRSVSVDLVRGALEVAVQAPSSCNRQSFRYLYFTEPEVVEALSDVPGGIAGYKVPAIVVLVGRYRGYFDERDLKAPIVDASLSAMGFILALETMGVSSVCINWPNQRSHERRIRRIIDLDIDEFIVMLVGIGYADPDGLIPFSAKLSIDQLFSANEVRRK